MQNGVFILKPLTCADGLQRKKSSDVLQSIKAHRKGLNVNAVCVCVCVRVHSMQAAVASYFLRMLSCSPICTHTSTIAPLQQLERLA